MLAPDGHAKCIYTTPSGLCPGTSPLHPKEHYLPAGLGMFRNNVNLKNYICYDCQKRFSQLETVFLQNGTEAFFRLVSGVKGRKKHRRKNIFAEPTLGLSPLTVSGAHPAFGLDILWELGGPGQALPLQQVVFRRQDGSHVKVPLRSGRMKSDMDRAGADWNAWELVFSNVARPDEEEYRSIFGDKTEGMRTVPLEEAAGKEIEGQMKAQISLPYVRAITKIAFHFVLAHFHFSGFEPEFNDIKRFIYRGTGNVPARIVDEPFMLQLLPENAYLTKWCHFLTAEIADGRFVCRMQFFAGPQVRPFVWRADFGANPSRIVTNMSKGVAFAYFEKPDKEGYAGVMSELQVGPKMLVTARPAE